MYSIENLIILQVCSLLLLIISSLLITITIKKYKEVEDIKVKQEEKLLELTLTRVAVKESKNEYDNLLRLLKEHLKVVKQEIDELVNEN